ncbi:hypothetical protein [Methanoplanus limicola]|uniref:Uncharacterized protein n=1 Tax=Methanoplanus limicola DSM 2279 TaxID=937775 RepID=H1YZS9_9EURY|nr:hypothetical protein [Methanoplanus limicola]EHQ34341.1 hypothetical protein Metlim_0188 [Methanoplanus limicola DSM 2279]
MNRLLIPFFALLLVSVIVSGTGAADVVLEDDMLVVKGVQDSIGLGAFSVVLEYGNSVEIQSVKGESGFLVASNIKDEELITLIAGISGDGLTGDIPVAAINKTGSGDIEVYVRELANVKGDPIPYTNPVYGEPVPTKAPEAVSSSGSSGGGISYSPSTDKTPDASATETQVKDSENTDLREDERSDQVPTGDSETIAITTYGERNNEVSDQKNEVKYPETTKSPLGLLVLILSIGSVFILARSKLKW